MNVVFKKGPGSIISLITKKQFDCGTLDEKAGNARRSLQEGRVRFAREVFRVG
jgi:hypothetical protein